MDTLDLMENGNIFQHGYDEIEKISKNYSRGTNKNSKGVRGLNPQLFKPTTPSISKYKLGTMVEDIKVDILHSLAIKMDTM